MLKIKDNVDLKELEKYGFKLDQSLDNGEYYWRNACLYIDNRIIKQMDMYNPFSEVDYEFDIYYVNILYDLIQAGLVEKVNGEDDEK